MEKEAASIRKPLDEETHWSSHSGILLKEEAGTHWLYISKPLLKTLLTSDFILQTLQGKSHENSNLPFGVTYELNISSSLQFYREYT